MKNFFFYRGMFPLALVCVLLAIPTSLHSQPTPNWEAYNDYRPSDLTHLNVSGYDLRVFDDGGPLLDFATGTELDASVFVVSESAPDDFGANSQVNPGSPADLLFGGKVDVGNSGIPGVRFSQDTYIIISFEGLDPNKQYNFRGTASRGGGYGDRWAVYTLLGVDAAVEAHIDGSDNQNIITKATFDAADLDTNQVALNSGDNKAGSLVGWDNIEPGGDGIFEIEIRQYDGAAPFGDPGAGPYGYGFTAVYLAEFDATGDLRITTNPSNQAVPSGQSVTLAVNAESPDAITYQWQSAADENAEFSDVEGATNARFTTPILTTADNGRLYRCVITSGANQATSAVATVLVDGIKPTITGMVGSINFNAVHLKFSEAMKLDSLANIANYEISGDLTIESVAVQDSTRVRLLTSAQTAGERYSVTVNNVDDVAGNKIRENSTHSFTAFTIQPGVVGLEVWNNTPAGDTDPNNLQIDPRYPDSPDEEFITTTFDSGEAIPNGPKNTYGARFRAWLTPEESGDYEFFIQSDGGSELHVGEDDDFAPLEDVDRIPNSIGSAGGVFNEDDDSYSLPVSMKAGQRYALMAIWQESNGPDYCQIAWRKTTDFTFPEDLVPIPSKFLSFYGPGPEPESPAKIKSIILESNEVILEWTGDKLQSTEDFITWTDEDGATNPYRIMPNTEKKFYRSVNP